jgi:DNA gyrase/topoisomerase IV subunit B
VLAHGHQNNQAVFVLNPASCGTLNVWDLKLDVMYTNDEMYNLMQSLSVEDNTKGLRYEKVILAADVPQSRDGRYASRHCGTI